ncbi:MAG: T9SS type A sorting domain-containing protein [Bacteroidota bacterium]|nr:T9SS type A sorting domain-containing protein [Bacteroidota bacterium]
MLQRKLLLISLFTVMVLLRLTAQVVTVHGLVTGVTGDPVENVDVTITAFFTDSSGVFETVTTNSEGIYQFEFNAPPNVQGWLQVGIVNCWGAFISEDFNILSTPVDFEANFEYCENITIDSCIVIINEAWNPGSLPVLVAWTPFASEAEYFWSTGDTTEQITPFVTGEYCVTVTFPFGCEAVDCYTFQDTFQNCFAWISVTTSQDGTITLEANGSGQGPNTYLWNSGESSNILLNAGPGTHCVTVTDSTGCAYGTCIFLDDPNFCEVYVYCDPSGALVAQGYGVEPITYAWSTGETGQVIFPSASGLYCVTATDANQCAASSCYDYFSFDTCFVYMSAFLYDSSTIALQAFNGFWGDSSTFIWSTGDTGDIIIIEDLSQDYCVTMTQTNGCETTACFDASNWCYAAVDVFYVDTTTATLSVYVDPIFSVGGIQISYAWSNGDTTSTIDVSASGSYCVTVSLGAVCVTEACTYVDFDSLQFACAAWVITYPDSNGNWFAEVFAWGYGTFDYLWSNGDTTSVTQLSFPNAYACVTVTSSFGCESVACADSLFNQCEVYASIFYTTNTTAEITANVWGGQGGTYTWSNGENGQTIQVTEEGTYCVTYVGGGCTSTKCVYVYFSSACSVFIESIPNPGGGTLVTAYPYGTPPFTYLWDNGATEQSQIIDFGDPNVCVTVTDSIGCVATGCNYKFDSCNVVLIYENYVTPQIHILSQTPLLYGVWNNGDTTQEILEITETGWYCVTTYDIYGCVDSTCIEIQTLEPNMVQNSINGFVYADSILNIQGIVVAYNTNSNGEAFQIIDSAQIIDHYYNFPDLSNGLYLLKAVIAPNTNGYDEYMPTYHLSSAAWEVATPHVLPFFLQVTTDIWMLPIDTSNGTGVIGGVITDPTGFTADEGQHSRDGEGQAGITILLSDQYGTPMDYTVSAEGGIFTFTGLAFGTYRITYDIPGIHSRDIWVTLSPENPEHLQVVLIVEYSVAVEEPTSIEVSISPNPAKNEINITVPVTFSSYAVQIVDMQGRVVYAGSVKSNNGIMHIEVSDYASGLYHVNLRGENHAYFGRFVKQE